MANGYKILSISIKLKEEFSNLIQRGNERFFSLFSSLPQVNQNLTSFRGRKRGKENIFFYTKSNLLNESHDLREKEMNT